MKMRRSLGDDLRQKERQKERSRIEAQRRAEGSRHIDDGVDAVDIEEEGDEEEDDALAVGKVRLLAEHREEALEAPAHRVFGAADEVRLLILLGEGQREAEPPQRVDEARDGHGDGDRKVGEVDEIDAEEEGDAATHIPEGIALGGNVVEAFGRRHVGEHGVVKDEADPSPSGCRAPRTLKRPARR